MQQAILTTLTRERAGSGVNVGGHDTEGENGKDGGNMAGTERLLINGDEAVARGARDAGVHLGTGYPGTPSTEILETLAALGGRAQWAPNEKVALEVGLGLSYAGARAIVTMKHVGLNVAADPLFTATLTRCSGGLVVVVADDPGMASSQNEQDSRRYAIAAGAPMLEPSDSQEAYDMVFDALALSEAWTTPVLLRLTTRVCHSKSIVRTRDTVETPPVPCYEANIPERVMIPAYARPAHRRLRERLARVAEWAEHSPLTRIEPGSGDLGIIVSGVSYHHVREAAPTAGVLKLGITHPLPIDAMRAFAAAHRRCVVIEEGDPVLVENCLAAGITVEGKPESFRFGELNVRRIERILAREVEPVEASVPGRPPRLCPGCPHSRVFELLRDMRCIVAGDIGCYTLGVLPPYSSIDTCVCMGASIGVGLGMRHALPEAEARRVVSVIGDSTFMHSGLTGLLDMVYNPPPSGHVVIILDNETTAMTGLQEHPGTGRALDHSPAHRVFPEEVARAMGVTRVTVVDMNREPKRIEPVIRDDLASGELCLIVARRPCILSAKRRHEAGAEARSAGGVQA
jgi:indolepyruvate ferredoxin oxidoreductase, alpha subunit